MKLQIKTLAQKSLVVDIEETKTVYDLKKELSLCADVGVEPELQRLIYSGKILNNNDQLSAYDIDVKKYLVIMILRQPLKKPPSINVAEEKQNIQDISASSNTGNSSLADVSKVKSAECLKAEDKAISSAVQGSDIHDMVKKITSMGVSEVEVRHALKACSNNTNLAIPPSSFNLEIDKVIDMDIVDPITPMEFRCRDEVFNNIRQTAFQNPELNAGMQQIAETNPALLNLVDENQEDFLAPLLKDMSDEGDDDEAEDGGE